MTGDQDDMYSRLTALLPPGWFGDENPVLDALLHGFAQALAWAFTLYLFALAQTRIKTATGGWLDMVALDFFGSGLIRYSSQSDSSYLNRITINLFRERGTRAGMSKVLYDLTGKWPTIIEPARPADVGGLGVSIGLGVAGGVGSISTPYQAFVTAYRPTNNGAAGWPGAGTNPFGLSLTGGLAPASQMTPQISDADIVAAIEATKPYGTTIWMRISN